MEESHQIVPEVVGALTIFSQISPANDLAQNSVFYCCKLSGLSMALDSETDHLELMQHFLEEATNFCYMNEISPLIDVWLVLNQF